MNKKMLISGISLIAVMALTGCDSSNTNGSSNSNDSSGNASASSNSSENRVGYFIDAAVAGLDYKTSSGISGTTDKFGKFEFKSEDSVTFSIGKLVLGEVKPQGRVVTPNDIVDSNDTAVKVLQMLQTLDSDGNTTNGIAISADLKEKISEHLGKEKNLQEFKGVDGVLDDEDILNALDTLKDKLDKDGDGELDIDSEKALSHFKNSLDKVAKGNLPDGKKLEAKEAKEKAKEAKEAESKIKEEIVKKSHIAEERANQAKKEAEEAKKMAEEVRKKAEEAKKALEEAKKKSQEALKEAQEAQDKAEKELKEAEEKAKKAQEKAKEEAKKAEEAKKKAEEVEKKDNNDEHSSSKDSQNSANGEANGSVTGKSNQTDSDSGATNGSANSDNNQTNSSSSNTNGGANAENNQTSGSGNANGNMSGDNNNTGAASNENSQDDSDNKTNVNGSEDNATNTTNENNSTSAENNQTEAQKGQFIDSPVEGLEYNTTSGISGATDENGYFEYKAGDKVTFKIGNLILGSTEIKKDINEPIVTPSDISEDDNEVKDKMLQLLQTLDSDKNASNGIKISQEVKSELEQLNEHISLKEFKDNNGTFDDRKLIEKLSVISEQLDSNSDNLLDVNKTEAKKHFKDTLNRFKDKHRFMHDFKELFTQNRDNNSSMQNEDSIEVDGNKDEASNEQENKADKTNNSAKAKTDKNTQL